VARRPRGPGALRAALVAAGLLLLGGAWFSAQVPRSQSSRIEPALGVIGVDTGRSFAWVLRTRHGAALIDAGMDRDAPALLDELRAEGLSPSQVHTILITHAHPDHWGGVRAFPSARVLAGAAEVPLLTGKGKMESLAARVFDVAGVMPPPLSQVAAVGDGQALDVDGEEIRAVALPGHTPGSTAYLWKDLLFTGDALLGKGDAAVQGPPSFLCEDAAQARRSLEKLRELPFTRIADGHAGTTAGARLKLVQLLGK
jgi:glyoxylase-like metal-dependent hydrolase (beta-lactamase superfamily II)